MPLINIDVPICGMHLSIRELKSPLKHRHNVLTRPLLRTMLPVLCVLHLCHTRNDTGLIYDCVSALQSGREGLEQTMRGQTDPADSRFAMGECVDSCYGTMSDAFMARRRDRSGVHCRLYEACVEPSVRRGPMVVVRDRKSVV